MTVPGLSVDLSATLLFDILLLLRIILSNEPAIPPPLPAPSVSPSVILVNIVLFLSLAINLSCAVMATLIRQWAHRYSRITQSPHYSLHHRARIRAFFAHGVNDLDPTHLIEWIQVLIEVSWLLFLSGLVILLLSVNLTVLCCIGWFLLVIFGVHLLAIITPFLRHESPYSWYSSFVGLSGHMEKFAAETIQKRASEIDDQIFKRIFDNLVEYHDSEVARFFEGILGFCNSSIAEGPLLSLTYPDEGKLSSALIKFLERTWSSNFVSDLDKLRHLVICVKVADVARLSDAASLILEGIFPEDRHEVLRSVEMGRSLRSGGNKTHQEIGLCAQTIVAGIISNVQGSDDHWIALAANQLRKSKDVLRGYLEHGNESVLLANLIHITRQIFHSSLGDKKSMADASSNILPSLSKFNIQNTLPGLQEEFRTLWKEININQTQNNSIPTKICESLLKIYSALTPSTDDTSTAPPTSSTNLNSYSHSSDSTSPDAGPSAITHPPADGTTEDIKDTLSMSDPMVPGPLSSPTPMPAPSSVLMESLRSPPNTAATDKDPLGTHDDTLDPNDLTWPKRARSSRQLEPPTANAAAAALQSENRGPSKSST